MNFPINFLERNWYQSKAFVILSILICILWRNYLWFPRCWFHSSNGYGIFLIKKLSWFACRASSHGRKMVLTPAGKHVYVLHRFPGIRAIITLISHVRIYLSHAHRFRPVISSAYIKGSHLIVTDTDTDTLSHRSDTQLTNCHTHSIHT